MLRSNKMKRKNLSKMIFPVAFSLVLLFAGQTDQDYRIFQTDKNIVIDGKLDEWDPFAEFSLDFLPEGTKGSGSPDIDARVKFTYDPRYFYVALRAVDDFFEFPQRAWRYGDGFYLTLVNPEQGNESDEFWSFGFSLEENKKFAVLVNRDGVYFPAFSTDNFRVEISLDKEKKTIIYEIAIPWESIIPVRPFIHPVWGINVIYVDRDRGERKIRQLFPDLNYDTEATKMRKGALFTFVNHSPHEPEFQSQLSKTHFVSDEDKVLSVAINSPYEAPGFKIQLAVSSPRKNFMEEESFSLAKGMNLIRHALQKENYPSGAYDISFGVFDKGGSLRYTGNHSFFIINQDELAVLDKTIAEIKCGKKYAEDAVFRNSLPTLEIRPQWIREFARNAHAYADMRDLKEWQEETQFLLEKVEKGEPALFPSGTLGRLAHRSEIDGTLQPFSLYVPDSYKGKEPIPLLVTLHGSGVDERQSAYSTTMRLAPAMAQGRITPLIILAPKARDLSSWYLGDAAKDVLECIEQVKKLYRIDPKKIIIDGFSMGGYGAWRLSILHPEVFRGAIIRSGAITPPPPLNGENIVDLLQPGIKVSYLVIHGDSDNAVSVSDARKAVEKLKELRIAHRYIEVKGGGHGNYDRWNEIFSWLRSLI